MEKTMYFWTITQPKDSVYILPIIIVTVLFLLAAIMVGITFSIRNINISIKDKEIEIKSFLYGRKIPVEDIIVNHCCPV